MICLVNRSNRAARSEWFVSVSGTPEFIAADTTLYSLMMSVTGTPALPLSR